MGGGTWDTGSYVSASSARKAAGIDDFDYDKKVKTGRASGIHALLDPKTVAGPTSPLAGQVVRESRDGPDHPESVPIAAFFDVTGSMGGIPVVLQKKLAKLMDVVIAKAGVKDPQILVGAIGDASPGYGHKDMTDRYPFQVGQFESDNRFDEALRAIILEGGGGGQVMESYGLAYFFAAYLTATDSWEKRGKKGYLITMGDEMPWPTIPEDQVEKIFGEEVRARVFGKKPEGREKPRELRIEDVLSVAQERWEIFHLFSMDGSYPNEKRIHDRWRELLGERFVKVEDSSLICEIIAGLIHMLESAADVDKVVADIGVTGAAGRAVKNALVPVAGSRAPAHLAKGKVPARKAPGKSGVSRV